MLIVLSYSNETDDLISDLKPHDALTGSHYLFGFEVVEMDCETEKWRELVLSGDGRTPDVGWPR